MFMFGDFQVQGYVRNIAPDTHGIFLVLEVSREIRETPNTAKKEITDQIEVFISENASGYNVARDSLDDGDLVYVRGRLSSDRATNEDRPRTCLLAGSLSYIPLRKG